MDKASGLPIDSEESIRTKLQFTYTLFQDIRTRFNGATVRRGGHERIGAASAYARKFGVDDMAAFQNVSKYSVESSYSDEQLEAVNETLIAFKGFIAGRNAEQALAQRIVGRYLGDAGPYFTLAMLKGTEDVLADFIAIHPDQVMVLDAIFRVAGGEGFRDLIHIYGIRLLEQALTNTEVSLPDLLAFVDIHDALRKDESGALVETKYEVWCPGHSLAKVHFQQCKLAAWKLVHEHSVQFSPTKQEEFLAIPDEISVHMQTFLLRLVLPVLTRYDIEVGLIM
jgi:hypothetical protein